MKNIKQKIFVVILIISLIANVVLVAFMFKGVDNFQGYIEEHIIPNVILVFTALGSIYLGLNPTISKVENSCADFNSATASATQSAKTSEQMCDEVSELKDEISTKIDGAGVQISDILGYVQRIEQIIKIGFCNSEELVRKGYAKQIYKVIANDGSNEENKTDEA